MARPPARGRSSGRSSRPRSSGGVSSQQALMIGGGAVVVLILVIVLMNSGGTAASTGGQTPATQPKPTAKEPTPAPSVQLAPKKFGKAPARPAPELTTATLQELEQLYVKATELHNTATKTRLAGDNAGARAQEAEAKQVLDQWKDRVSAQLLWQEEAQMEDWAQPAEYVTLANMYGKYSNLTKHVRMGGG